MIPLKISEVRKTPGERFKIQIGVRKTQGGPCLPRGSPLARFYGASNARNAACQRARLKSADDTLLSLSLFLPLFSHILSLSLSLSLSLCVCVYRQTRRIPDINRRTV